MSTVLSDHDRLSEVWYDPCRRPIGESAREEPPMSTILLIILILILLGALPLWPYSSGWGYYPSGGLGLLLLIVLVLLLVGRV